MDKSFILASHGKFADGLYNTLKFIVGEQKNFTTICGYVDDCNIENKIEKTVNSLNKQKTDIIVLTDIYGGSINNFFMRYVEKENFFLISGVNLPLVMEMICNQNLDTEEMIKKAVTSASKSIIYCNHIDYSKQDEDF